MPHDFSFELSEVRFVVVPDYEAVATFPKALKDAIGREKFIMISVYSQIEKFVASAFALIFSVGFGLNLVIGI